MAGAGEVCSHVGAILFAVEYITHQKSSISCTDIRALWKVPTVSKVECEPIRSINFGRIIKGSNITGVPSIEGQQLWQFLTDIIQAGSSSVITRIVEPWATAIAEEMQSQSIVENPFGNLYNEDFQQCGLHQLITMGSELDMGILQDDCVKVEITTNKQAASGEWFKQRVGRITASIFRMVCKTSITKPSLTCVKKICYPVQMKFKTAATKWGKSKEPVAIQNYIEYSRPQHTNLRCSNSGLIIRPDLPEFGATPDAIVICQCCGKGCVEVKCPFLLKNMSLTDFAKLKTSCLILSNGNEIYLNPDCSYFFQVQMQMAISGTTYCDFVVWAPTELFVQRVNFNKDFWLRYMTKAKEFHKQVIIPELLGRYYTKDGLTTMTWCICNGVDDGRPMILCDNDRCPIEWYHMDCMQMTIIPENLWLCNFCQC